VVARVGLVAAAPVVLRAGLQAARAGLQAAPVVLVMALRVVVQQRHQLLRTQPSNRMQLQLPRHKRW
jgi:hypothetical protein